MIPLETDIIHEHGEQKDWNEGFYFSFYDRGNDICGFMRLGLRPNRNEKTLHCFLMMPDGSLVGTKESIEFDGPTLSAKGVAFTKVEDEKVWNLSFAGELPSYRKGEDGTAKVSFDLRFEGLSPVFDYRECASSDKETLAAAVGSEHLEQMGKVLGSLSVDGREYYVKGLGERDHTWGEKDWTAPRGWVWLACQVNEGFGFNVTKLYLDKGEYDAGFLYMDGETLPVVKVDMVTEYDADGSPNTLFMAMYDKEGVVYGVKGEVKKKAVLEFKDGGDRGSILFETLAKYRIDDGDDAGYGIAEYLFRK